MKRILKLIAAASLLGMVQGAMADSVVVVSSQNPVTSLSAEQVSQLFLGKTSTFPGGAQAVPIDLPEGSAARDDFYSKVVNKSGAQLKAYWSKIIFTGKGQPPREVPAGEVKTLVAKNPSTIAYIDKSQVDSSVRVVFQP